MKNTKYSHKDFTLKSKNIVYNVSAGKVYLAIDNIRQNFEIGAKVKFTSGTLDGLKYTILDTITGEGYSAKGTALTTIILDGIDTTKIKIGDGVVVYWDLLSMSPDEFSNTTIVGSMFYEQGTDRVQILPTGSTGVIFDHCNIDNAILPIGCSNSGKTTHKHVVRQNDCEYWNVDTRKPMNEKEYDDLGLSTDWNDLPATPLDKSVLDTAREALLGGG